MNYQTWLAHFRANREDRPEPDWSADPALGGVRGSDQIPGSLRKLKRGRAIET